MSTEEKINYTTGEVVPNASSMDNLSQLQKSSININHQDIEQDSMMAPNG